MCVTISATFTTTRKTSVTTGAIFITIRTGSNSPWVQDEAASVTRRLFLCCENDTDILKGGPRVPSVTVETIDIRHSAVRNLFSPVVGWHECRDSVEPRVCFSFLCLRCGRRARNQ